MIQHFPSSLASVRFVRQSLLDALALLTILWLGRVQLKISICRGALAEIVRLIVPKFLDHQFYLPDRVFASETLFGKNLIVATVC